MEERIPDWTADPMPPERDEPRNRHERRRSTAIALREARARIAALEAELARAKATVPR